MTIVALFTDFGWKGQHYIAEMIGVLYSINPDIKIINAFHGIHPYSIPEAQYLLDSTINTFPDKTIIICVVDPGVGTSRKILAIQRQNGQILIGPDNGIFTDFMLKERNKIYSIENQDLFHKGTDGAVSASFHGRDIMAPVAAHLSKGFPLENVGPIVDMPVLIEKPAVGWENDCVEGHVLYIDDFGNVITDISTIGFNDLYQQPLTLNGIPVKMVSNFLEGKEDELLIMGGSAGYIEIVMNQKNAAKEIMINIGDTVKILAVPKYGTPEEILACFNYPDIKAFHTGKFTNVFPYPRRAAHAKKIPHFICRIFLFTEDKKFLVQQRSTNRSSHPEMFTDSASGHLRYKKPFDFEFIGEEILREAKEEMNAEVYYYEFLDLSMEKHTRGKDVELSFNFIGLCKDKFTCNKEECGERSGFYSKEQLVELLQNENWVPFALLYWNKIIQNDMDSAIIENYKKQQADPIHDNHGISNTTKDDNKSSSNISNPDSLGSDESVYNITEVNKIGAFIGRFQPFHFGHLYFALEALKYVKLLKIGVGSSQYSNTEENPYDFETRKRFIEAALTEYKISKDRYEIYAVPDIHNNEKWADHVINVLGDFDFVFSNSDWVRALLSRAKKAVWKKIPIEMDKYNGTLIRKLLKDNKDISDYLPKSVCKLINACRDNKKV